MVICNLDIWKLSASQPDLNFDLFKSSACQVLCQLCRNEGQMRLLRPMSTQSYPSHVPLQPSPIKKDRSPRPQSFCHSSSLSPHDKLSLPGFISQRDKQQRLSYSAFTNQMYSTSTDLTSSPVADGPPLPPRNQGKGQNCPLQAPLSLRNPFSDGVQFDKSLACKHDSL